MGTMSPEVRCRGDPALMPQAGPLGAVETEPGEQVVAGLSSFWAAPSKRVYRTFGTSACLLNELHRGSSNFGPGFTAQGLFMVADTTPQLVHYGRLPACERDSHHKNALLPEHSFRSAGIDFVE
jgi:hypothetical protein